MNIKDRPIYALALVISQVIQNNSQHVQFHDAMIHNAIV